MRMTQEELASHSRWRNFGDLKDSRGLEHPPMRGWLAVPVLRQNGAPIGVLQVTDRVEGEYSTGDEATLAELAQLIGSTFELEYVRDELQRSNHELEQLGEQLELRVRERTEELSQAVEELSIANKELDAFVHIASHDLQEPLRTLVSYSTLLEQDLGEDLPEQAAQDLHFMSDAANRMRGLVQDLLALSRAGRAALRPERVRLDNCVDASLEALRTRLEESGARVKRELLPEVTGDAILLTQIYQNLLANAMKFTGGKEPAIELTVEKVNRE